MGVEVEWNEQFAVDGDGYVNERRHVDDALAIVGREPEKRALMQRIVVTLTTPWASPLEHAAPEVYALHARMMFGDWAPAGVYLSPDGARAGAAQLHRLFGNTTTEDTWAETVREGDCHHDFERADGRFRITRSALRR